MPKKKDRSVFDYLDSFVLANAMVIISKRVGVAAATLVVRASAAATRKAIEARRRRRFLR